MSKTDTFAYESHSEQHKQSKKQEKIRQAAHHRLHLVYDDNEGDHHQQWYEHKREDCRGRTKETLHIPHVQ